MERTSSVLRLHKLPNDITTLIDEAGNTVVNYTYDSWGKILSITGSLKDTVGQQNLFRYRGYYYDKETGMYYLKNRYYDPELRRFICADKSAVEEVKKDAGSNSIWTRAVKSVVVKWDGGY